MKSIKELALKASLAAMVATGVAATSTASAYTVSAFNIDGTANNAVETSKAKLASELDFTTAAKSGAIEVVVTPSADKAFSGTDLLATVTITGATFTGNLTNASAVKIGDGFANASISTGGAKGGTTVSYVITDAGQALKDNTKAFGFRLPVDVAGNADVTVTVDLVADGSKSPIDNVADTVRTVTALTLAKAFEVDIVADTTDTTIDLDADPVFTDLAGGAKIGTIEVSADTSVLLSISDTTKKAANANVTDATVLIEGNFANYGSDGAKAGGNVVSVGAVAAAASKAFDSATLKAITVGAVQDVTLINAFLKDGALNSSEYEATVTLTLDTALNLQKTFSVSGDLETVDREGTVLVFPWIASNTQAGVSGSVNQFRFGNLGSRDDVRVFVRVENYSVTPTVTTDVQIPADVNAKANLDANGEFLVTAQILEGLLGNWGRGDLVFTIEEQPTNVTGRRILTRPEGVFESLPGTANLSKN